MIKRVKTYALIVYTSKNDELNFDLQCLVCLLAYASRDLKSKSYYLDVKIIKFRVHTKLR
jgi:hypothetical protein